MDVFYVSTTNLNYLVVDVSSSIASPPVQLAQLQPAYQLTRSSSFTAYGNARSAAADACKDTPLYR